MEREVLILVSSDRTHGNHSKLHQGRFRLDILKHFFTEKVFKHWNRLPREIVNATMPVCVKEAFGQCP